MHTRFVLVSCFFLAACGGAPGTPPPSDGGGVATDAAQGPAITFSDVYGQTLSACAQACHFTGNTEGTTLYMEDQATTYEVLLGKTGSGPSESSTPYVTPKDPQASYLYLKVTGAESAGPRMPLGEAPLSDAQVAALASWIDGGALDD